MQKVIEIKAGVARMPQFRLAEPADITIEAGEQVAIAGPNGAGKSLLVDLMTGARPLLHGTPAYDFGPGRSTRVSDNVKYIAFRDAYGDGQEPAYYQQRWNQGDETVWPTVRELLLKSRTTDTEDPATTPQVYEEMIANIEEENRR